MEFEKEVVKSNNSGGSGISLIELLIVFGAMAALIIGAMTMLSNLKRGILEKEIISDIHSIVMNDYQGRDISFKIDTSNLETTEPKLKITDLEIESCVKISYSLRSYDQIKFSINNKNIINYNAINLIESCSLNDDNNIIDMEIDR
jgi:hypothetical protein